MESLVSGSHRHLFTRRPIIPMLQSVPENIVMKMPESEHEEKKVEEEEEPYQKTRTVAVQSVYRESEAQTDPFSPDYIIAQGHNPEVLTITNFTYGNGLPASMAEMELIEQAREKRAFDNALPPTSDEANFVLRRRLMEEQEIREWNKREDDIKRVQNERLNLLQSALLEREKDNEEKDAQRIEEIRLKKTENKDRGIAKIQRRRIKILRKMFKARKNVEGNLEKRDIIEDYANFGSKVYAPITREGLSLDKKANKYEVQPEALTSYEGMSDLAMNIPSRYFETNVQIKALETKIEKKKKRKEVHHLANLAKATEIIERPNKVQEEKTDNVANDKYSFKNIQVRPDTPKLYKDDEERPDDKKQAAIILIQRLLRGRGIQNAMFEGKEMRLDLIHELRSAEEWRQASTSEEEKNLVQKYQEGVMDGVLEGLQGEVMSETMDNLSKELVRFKQERKIAAMVKLAERDRRMREAEESGRRQAEEILREREDILFKELLGVHQGTVDSYLTNLMSDAVDTASAVQAVDEARLKTTQLSRIVDGLEMRLNNPAMVVRELLQSFLVPEIERQKVRRQLKVEEKRFLETARKLVSGSNKIVGEKLERSNPLKFDNLNK